MTDDRAAFLFCEKCRDVVLQRAISDTSLARVVYKCEKGHKNKTKSR